MDPFAPSRVVNERVVRIASIAALGWSIAYLVWRIGFTLGGADGLAGATLIGAEVLGVVVFAARLGSAWHTPIRVVASPGAPMPDIAAVVDASGSSADELRTTLVALRRVQGIDRTRVVDRSGSRRLQTIAERFGATVVDPAVSLDDAVVGAGASWVLLLRSGDLPMPDLVSVAAPRCSSPDVAVIQVGIEEADPTSFEHDPDGHWSLEPFEQQVVRPALAARGSIPWYGDGPALVRRSAVAQLASTGNGHMLDASYLVGLDIVRTGLTITHLPLTLARVRGPQGLGESLVRRHDRTARALRTLRRRHLSGVPRSLQIAHLLALLPLVAAVQRVLLVVTAVLVLALARVPMHAAALDLAVLAVPAYLLRWNAHILLGRGRLGLFSILRSDLRSLGVDLTPFGRIRPEASRAGLRAVVATVIALDGAVILASISMWRDWEGRLPIAVASTALILTAGFLGVATEVLLDALARRQRRADHRVRLGLVTCRIEEIDGQLVDLSTGGAGIVVPELADDDLPVGAVTTVAFRIPDADGAWRNVSTLVRVAHRRPDPDGGVRIGLAFDEPTDAPLDPVVEFLTIDRRLVALGRHTPAAL
ncbi:MAG: PilZ domain-containing protein [Acidimicrobiales bacterium]